jgi:hypothetical protein
VIEKKEGLIMLEKAKNRKIFYFFILVILGFSLFISPVFAAPLTEGPMYPIKVTRGVALGGEPAVIEQMEFINLSRNYTQVYWIQNTSLGKTSIIGWAPPGEAPTTGGIR